MSLDEQTNALALEVSRFTGETVEKAVRTSLRERLEREQRLLRTRPIDWSAVDAAVTRYKALPVLDNRSADEILGYDENGLSS